MFSPLAYILIVIFIFLRHQMSVEWNLSTTASNTITTPSASPSTNSREELIDILTTFQKVSLAAPYLIIEPVALVLNFVILIIIWNREKHIRKLNANAPYQIINRSQLRTYYFLRHLVFSDLLTCFVAIPFDAMEIYCLEFRRSHQ